MIYIYEKRDCNEALLDIWYYFMHLFPESPRVSRMRKKMLHLHQHGSELPQNLLFGWWTIQESTNKREHSKKKKKSWNSTSKAPLVQGHLRNCVWESFKKRKKLGKIAEELVEEKKVKKQESKLKVARREEFQRGSMSTLIYKLMYNYFPDIIILMNLIMVSL